MVQVLWDFGVRAVLACGSSNERNVEQSNRITVR